MVNGLRRCLQKWDCEAKGGSSTSSANHHVFERLQPSATRSASYLACNSTGSAASHRLYSHTRVCEWQKRNRTIDFRNKESLKDNGIVSVSSLHVTDDTSVEGALSRYLPPQSFLSSDKSKTSSRSFGPYTQRPNIHTPATLGSRTVHQKQHTKSTMTLAQQLRHAAFAAKKHTKPTLSRFRRATPRISIPKPQTHSFRTTTTAFTWHHTPGPTTCFAPAPDQKTGPGFKRKPQPPPDERLLAGMVDVRNLAMRASEGQMAGRTVAKCRTSRAQVERSALPILAAGKETLVWEGGVFRNAVAEAAARFIGFLRGGDGREDDGVLELIRGLMLEDISAGVGEAVRGEEEGGGKRRRG